MEGVVLMEVWVFNLEVMLVLVTLEEELVDTSPTDVEQVNFELIIH